MKPGSIETWFAKAECFELLTGERGERNICLYTALGHRILRTESLSAKVTLVFMEKTISRDENRQSGCTMSPAQRNISAAFVVTAPTKSR